MKYLTAEEILVIHSEIIDGTGGMHGVRDIGLLMSIAEKPKSRFGGKELYEGVFQKAAIFLGSLVQYHVFIDGNKRAAVACAIEFLERNAQVFIASNDEVVAFPLWVERNRPEIEEIARWFKRRCRRLTKRRKSEEDSKSD